MTSMLQPKDWKTLPRRAATATEIVAALSQLDGWKLTGDGADVAIEKTFTFANYFETIAFVNALAFIAHTQRTIIPTCRSTTTAAWCASTRTTSAGSRPAISICARQANALLAAPAVPLMACLVG